jgi:hypothetical protein
MRALATTVSSTTITVPVVLLPKSQLTLSEVIMRFIMTSIVKRCGPGDSALEAPKDEQELIKCCKPSIAFLKYFRIEVASDN